MGYCKRGRKRTGWNFECKKFKKRVRKELRKWKNGEEELETYGRLKIEYKKLCDRKKKEESDRWIEVARTEREVWEVEIETERRGKECMKRLSWRNRRSILRTCWGGVDERVVKGMGRKMRENEEAEITMEEIRKTVGRVKDGKAVEVDSGRSVKIRGRRAVGMCKRLCNRIWKRRSGSRNERKGLL